MTGHQQLYILASHLLLATLIVVAATVLGALHDINPQAVVAIFGTAVGLIGGAASTMASVGGILNGKSLVSNTRLQQIDTERGVVAPPTPQTTDVPGQ